MWELVITGTISRYSRIFILKRLYLSNHGSYELESWHEYSSTILTRNSEPLPLPVWAGRASVFENRRFMPLFGGSPLVIGGLL
jgi:hypothetical protein